MGLNKEVKVLLMPLVVDPLFTGNLFSRAR
jgi:hypothetical protein